MVNDELIQKLVDRMGDEIADYVVGKTLEMQHQLGLTASMREPLAACLAKLACELVTRTAELYTEIQQECNR
jgi:hypothetical protein